jgi:ATP-dependent DNA helicase RecQ
MPDYARWNRVTQQRYTELEQMKAYLLHDGCLMRFIATALDDPTTVQPCGRCKNCRQQQSKYVPSTADLNTASRFLREGQSIQLVPRKQWPTGFSDTLKGKIKPPNAVGLALCYYYDSGWGALVREGKYRDGHFADELVDASVELLRATWKSLTDPRPTWVTAVPSLRHPTLVPDFAAQLAKRLDLPYLQIAHQTQDRPEQKTMLNSHQQLSNLLGTFTVDPPRADPVLLVDDLWDSGWTMTVLGDLLRQHGSGEVHPFVLARMGASG